MKTVEEQFKIITKGVDRLVNEKELKEKFEQRAIPDNIPKLVIDYQNDLLLNVISLLVENHYVSSSSEF